MIYPSCRGVRLRFLLLCVGFVLASSCHAPPPAPVDQRPPPPSQKINFHVVSSDETLFAIAWRYEKDLEKLARANGLSPPYTIYRGQRLTLDTNRLPPLVSAPPPVKKQPKTATPPPSTEKKDSPPVKVAKPAPKLPESLPSVWRWQWPTQGRVIRYFNSTELFKGVDIESHSGQAVVAAAPGVVVYSGSGLRGYGELIIVKHSEEFLSAYAHSRQIFVKEGQMVKGGEKIAEVGGDPANSKRLYFEIRQKGKPVNPLNFLPRK